MRGTCLVNEIRITDKKIISSLMKKKIPPIKFAAMKKQLFARVACVLMIIGALSWISAAGTSIGMAVADGRFHLDQAVATGTGTLFEGSRIETLSAPSQLKLNQGARFRMGAAARAAV